MRSSWLGHWHFICCSLCTWNLCLGRQASVAALQRGFNDQKHSARLVQAPDLVSALESPERKLTSLYLPVFEPQLLEKDSDSSSAWSLEKDRPSFVA